MAQDPSTFVSSREASTQLNNLGFVVFRQILNTARITEAQYYGDALMQRCLLRQNGVGNVVHNLFRTDDVVPDFLLPAVIHNELVWDTIALVLGDNFNLIEGFIHFSLPGSARQELHLDVNHLFDAPTLTTPPFLLAMHIPLCDFNASSGGTRIVPGSHLTRIPPTRIEDETDTDATQHTLTMSPGDVLLRDCRAWHGAGANTGTYTRGMFSFAFSCSWHMAKARISDDLYFALPLKARYAVRKR